ncbi:SLC13 family permease [uncultured Cohaesibacter sp.]|uniref:SLC13 family permease n=1 Tax=uncultured Cohaesibacter sp. TaxID=1002546 RepID=UPI002AA86489|nr:SLC13 family permease [uncultured Cohaesibacter sp.]
MSWEMIFTFIVLGAAVILFLADKLRLDLVAIIVMLALGLSGILTPAEMLSGFGSTVVILIAGLFIVGEALAQTGISYAVGDKIVQIAGDKEWKLIVLLMLAVASLASVMSVTGSGAIFIPIAIRLANRASISPSRLLLPLAYGALIGGMLTLIGTPPNLVANAELQKAGMEPFNFFVFTPIGLIMLAMAIVHMLIYGRFLLPAKDSGSGITNEGRRTLQSLLQSYAIEDKIIRLVINADSKLIGETVVSARLRREAGLTLFALERKDNERSKVKAIPVDTETIFEAGDILFGVVDAPLSEADAAMLGVQLTQISEQDYHLSARELGMADLVIPQESNLVGRTISGAGFRTKHGLSVVGAMRHGKPIHDSFGNTKLEFGDQLLVVGDWERIRKLRAYRENFLLLSFPEEMENYLPRRKFAPVALGILAIMLVLIIFRLVPSVTAVVLAATAMVCAGCVSPKRAYESINWPSLVLIAGMIPMAAALDKTGGLALLVDNIVAVVGNNAPYAMLIALFLLTSIFSQFTSNTATAVLVAPVAFQVAGIMDVRPEPMLMSVAIAASTAFCTPVASPINTLVMGPGNYRFMDYVRIGVPLQILSIIVAALIIPVFLPF